jgi:hypothetical protein
MPLYLDVHNKIDGLTTDGAAEAHRKDLEVQHKHRGLETDLADFRWPFRNP